MMSQYIKLVGDLEEKQQVEEINNVDRKLKNMLSIIGLEPV